MQLKILDCYAEAIKSYYIKLQIAFGNTVNRMVQLSVNQNF